MTAAAETPPPGVDYSRRWLVMTAIAMGVFLGTIDGSIVNSALPTLVDDLDTTFPAVQWVVISYLLTLATLTLLVGRLGDMWGKKPIYTGGFALFTVASTLCGLAPGIGWLIGFRVLQGVGSAMVFALGFAILTEAFPPSERGRALGLVGSFVSIGIAIGPALGGIIIDAASWHWIFLVNLPVGIVGTWTAWRFVPDIPAPGGQRFDRLGAAVFFAGLLSMMLGLTMGQRLGFGHPAVLSMLAAGVVAVVVFVAIERRVADPMLDLSLFRSRLLSVNLVTGFVTFVAIAGALFLLPFYLQGVLGYDTREMGVLLAVPAVTLGLFSPFSGSLSDRIGSRPVSVAGLAILVAGYLSLAALGTGTPGWVYILLVLPIGIGMGVFQSPNNSAILGSVPPQRLGVTSGLLTITRITGQLTGIAVLGTVWATIAVAPSAGADPTAAPAADQVAALRVAMTVAAALVGLAFLLAVWVWHREARQAGPGSLSPEAPSQRAGVG